MQKQNKQEISIFSTDIDFYRIVTDILKKWWLILIVSISVSLLSYIVVNENYHPQYTVSATYVITTKGTNASVFSNLSTAQDTAAKFSQIINSNALQKKVAEELGVDGIPGTIRSEIIPETNLMNLSVTASTPQMAFQIVNSVMNNYKSISDYMIGNAIMEILQAPEITDKPDVTPNVLQYMGRAFILTFAILIFLIGILSYLKDTIKKSSEVERKLDARLLGTILHENKYKTIKSKIYRKNTSLLITNPTVSFGYVESFHKIASKVSNIMNRKEAKTLLITSYMENEGKSTVAANTALSLSQSDKKVLLIDADFRKPAQYKIFDLADNEFIEFGEILKGGTKSENLIRKVKNTNLYMIFNTDTYTDTSEMIASGRIEKLFSFLKKYFDYIIIDSPPMALVSDTEEMADMADASIIVVREHNAEARDINDMIYALSGCKASFLGCVYNDAHTGIFGTSSGYGSSYGKYYNKYYNNYNAMTDR